MCIVVFPADDSNLNLIACFLNDLLCPGHLKDQDLSFLYLTNEMAISQFNFTYNICLNKPKNDQQK